MVSRIVRLIVGLIPLTPANPAVAAPLPQPPSFAMCSVCHKVNAGEKPTIGPVLWGVGGRTAGSMPDYAYSPAMKAAKFKWTRNKLIDYLAAPQKVVPNTKMAYPGQPDPKQAALLADYVLSLK